MESDFFAYFTFFIDVKMIVGIPSESTEHSMHTNMIFAKFFLFLILKPNAQSFLFDNYAKVFLKVE